MQSPKKRFGQDAVNHPYAAINLRCWERFRFDLAWTTWYNSRDAAAGSTAASTASTEAEDRRTCVEFAAGLRVELRLESRSRWRMWVGQYAKIRRSEDFAAPDLDHGRRTAERWYGTAVGDWHERSRRNEGKLVGPPKNSGMADRRSPGTKSRSKCKGD